MMRTTDYLGICRNYLGRIALGASLVLGGMAEDAYASCKPNRPGILVGTPASLKKQQAIARKDNLSMLTEDKDKRDWKGYGYIKDFVKNGLLVRIRDTRTYDLDDVEYPYTRPHSKLFLDRLASQYYENFGKRLVVSGASRTVEYQKELMEENENATIPAKSPHVRGAALDFRHDKMSYAGAQWVRRVLSSLERKGLIEATEECSQPVFHVMVSKSYVSYVNSLTKQGAKKKRATPSAARMRNIPEIFS